MTNHDLATNPLFDGSAGKYDDPETQALANAFNGPAKIIIGRKAFQWEKTATNSEWRIVRYA